MTTAVFDLEATIREHQAVARRCQDEVLRQADEAAKRLRKSNEGREGCFQ